jgi:hypothetical protein
LESQPKHVLLKKLSQMKKRKTGASNACILDSSNEALEGYRKYFAGVYKNQNDQESTPSEQPVQIFDTNWIGLGYHDCKRAISKTPSDKAAGLDDIKCQILKVNLRASLELLYPLFQCIIKTGVSPSMWNQCKLVPIWKNKGSPQEIQNYRPISLTLVVRKIFERFLFSQIHQELGELDISQGGFRSKRSTLDQSYALDTLMKSIHSEKRDFWALFLDIKAAYDSVDRTILWRKLEQRNVSLQSRQILSSLFDHCYTQIVVDGRSSSKVWLKSGLLQGSVLSPILYCAFIDDLPERIRNVSGEIPHLYRLRCNSFFFADDIAAIALSQHQLQEIASICETHAMENNYRYAPSKCVIIQSKNAQTTQDILLHDEPIPIVEEFKYLGIWFNERGIDRIVQVQRNIAKAKAVAIRMQSVGFNSRGFSPTLTIHAYKTFLRPILEWGLAIVKVRAAEMKKLESAQTDILKRGLTLSRSVSNGCLLLTTRIQLMEFRMEFQKVKTFCRFLDHDDTFMANHAVKHSLFVDINMVFRENPFGNQGLDNSEIWQELLRRKNILTGAGLGVSFSQCLGKVHPMLPTSLKHLQFEKSVQSIYQRDQLMIQLTANVGLISPILLAKPGKLSRKQLRLLYLWKVGVLPTHPYKFCKSCLPEQIPASRNHLNICYDLDSALPEPETYLVHQEHQYHEEATKLDILIDNLQLQHYKDPPDNDWWALAAYHVQNICFTCLSQEAAEDN